jgi:N-carbamoylputrescine amidase
MNPFRLGLVQMSSGTSASENLEKAVNRTRDAARQGAQIICLQELFRTEYFCQREDAALFDLAEPIPGPTTELFARIAKEAAVAIVASVFERRSAGLYHNTAVVLDADGSLVGIYRKMHIPDDPLYYEKYYFTPGDLGFRAFPTRFGKVGTLVCWDQWYPEAAASLSSRGRCPRVPDRDRLAPSEKARVGASQHPPGDGPADRTPSPTASSCSSQPRRTRGTSGAASTLGGRSPPSGALAGIARQRDLVVECDPKKSESTRRNWPFCVTAASMLTTG